MSFAPIALTMPQYDRTLYAGYWLKAYEQGTTTPLNMATDATGGTTLVKAELDTQGFPLTAGSARFIPFIDGDYDLWLFPTEAEADANDTTNAIQIADNLNADPDSTGQFSLWDTSLTYNIPEIILGSDDNYYRSIIDSNSGNDPTSSPVQWELLRFGRIWNTNITYAIGDSAYGSDGHLYIARVSQSGNDPISDPVNWDTSTTRIEVSQDTTSGTTVDFTDIPSWVKRITVLTYRVQTDGTDPLLIQIGDSGGLEATGYTASTTNIRDGLGTSAASSTGFRVVIAMVANTSLLHSVNTLVLLDPATNLWSFSSTARDESSNFVTTGSKALTATLDRLTITTATPDTFTDGKINVLYEG